MSVTARRKRSTGCGGDKRAPSRLRRILRPVVPELMGTGATKFAFRGFRQIPPGKRGNNLSNANRTSRNGPRRHQSLTAQLHPWVSEQAESARFRMARIANALAIYFLAHVLAKNCPANRHFLHEKYDYPDWERPFRFWAFPGKHRRPFAKCGFRASPALIAQTTDRRSVLN